MYRFNKLDLKSGNCWKNKQEMNKPAAFHIDFIDAKILSIKLRLPFQLIFHPILS